MSVRRTGLRTARPRAGGDHSGFTLIELLVVVAIIALLISILLPSLSKARAQARSTLCGSRISQLCQALLLYANDYDGGLPFVGRGWENAIDTWQDPMIWPKTSGNTMTVLDWKYAEDWLMADMPDFWTEPVEEWPEGASVRTGTLFDYVRFERIYRCPEFARVPAPAGAQRQFNYTRTLLGRKWYHYNDPEGRDGSPWFFDNWAGAPGPVMKVDQIFAPARLHMLIDERWDKHCGAGPEGFTPPTPCGGGLLNGLIEGSWMAADPLCGLIGDEYGQYHGAPMYPLSTAAELRELLPQIQRCNAAFYDGHVELVSDPLPDRTIEGNQFQLFATFLDWVGGHIFAQRGPTEVRVQVPL